MESHYSLSAAAYHRLWKVGSWVNSIQITPIMAMNSVSVMCFVPPSKVYTACRNTLNIAVTQKKTCCQVHAKVSCRARCIMCSSNSAVQRKFSCVILMSCDLAVAITYCDCNGHEQT